MQGSHEKAHSPASSRQFRFRLEKLHQDQMRVALVQEVQSEQAQLAHKRVCLESAQLNERLLKAESATRALQAVGGAAQGTAEAGKSQAELVQLGVKLALAAQAPTNQLLNTAILGLSRTSQQQPQPQCEREFAALMNSLPASSLMSWQDFVSIDSCDYAALLGVASLGAKVTLKRLYKASRAETL